MPAFRCREGTPSGFRTRRRFDHFFFGLNLLPVRPSQAGHLSYTRSAHTVDSRTRSALREPSFRGQAGGTTPAPTCPSARLASRLEAEAEQALDESAVGDSCAFG